MARRSCGSRSSRLQSRCQDVRPIKSECNISEYYINSHWSSFFYIYSNKCIDILTKSNALHFIIAACWLWRERRKNKIPETNAHDHFTTNTKSKCAFSTRRERELCARPRCRTAMSARDVICRICTHLTHPKNTPQTYMLYFILCKHGIYIHGDWLPLEFGSGALWYHSNACMLCIDIYIFSHRNILLFKCVITYTWYPWLHQNTKPLTLAHEFIDTKTQTPHTKTTRDGVYLKMFIST